MVDAGDPLEVPVSSPRQQEAPLRRTARGADQRGGETSSELFLCQETLDLEPSISRVKHPHVCVWEGWQRPLGPSPLRTAPSPLLRGCHSFSHVVVVDLLPHSQARARSLENSHSSFRWLGRGLLDVPWPQCLYSVLLAGPIPSTSHLSSCWGHPENYCEKEDGKFCHSFPNSTRNKQEV